MIKNTKPVVYMYGSEVTLLGSDGQMVSLSDNYHISCTFEPGGNTVVITMHDVDIHHEHFPTPVDLRALDLDD